MKPWANPRFSYSRMAIATAIAILLIPLPLPGQVESGKVVGTVRDPSGAAVAAASVAVTNSETNLIRQVASDSTGDYVVPELKPGTYTVSVEKEGFKKALQTPFKLDVNQVIRVDITLAVGSFHETVAVTAAEPLVESQTSSLGQVIEESRVNNLPLNGRNFIQLAYLSPGVNQGPAGIVQQGDIPEDERGNGAIQANGLMATNNNFLLNGFDNNEQQIGFEVIQPAVDAIQEFKVQTNNFGADIGRGGAVVNVVLKSGTNRFHGSVYEFLRNSAFDAKNYFDDPTLPIPPYKQNQFGGTFGGPIAKDKTFFFLDYQGTRIRQSQTDISTVPSPAERSGDFSDLLPTTQLTDPVTGQPFLNNQIPACPSPTGGACLDPAGVNVLNLYPSSNRPGAGMVNNFLYNPVLKNNQDSFDARLDHQLGVRNSLFATFSYGNVDATRPDPFPGLAGGGTFSGNISNKALAAGISDVHTFSRNQMNELKIGYTRYVVNAIPFFYGQPIAQQVGIPGINLPDDPATGGLPNFVISRLSSVGNQDWFPENLRENNYQLLDSLNISHGRHVFKLGGDLRLRQHGFFQTQNPRGDLTFTGQFTGDSVADLAIGYVQDAFRDGQKGAFGMSWWEISAYFMDDYRVSSRLTLNMGLRYDIFTPMVEQHDRLANFDFATGLFVAPGMPGVSRSGNVELNLHNLAPRFGFAYTPWDDRNTVLRGGFGIFYDQQANQNDAELAFNPTGLFGSQPILVPTSSTTPAMTLSQGFPTALPFPTLAQPSGRASAFFFNNATTYIEEWNLNLEHQLMKDAVLQLAYVGTHGVHLSYLRDLNQPVHPADANFCPAPYNPTTCATGPPSNFGRPYYGTVPGIAAIRTEGHDISSITHGLQVRFEKRFSANWSMLNAYTWQHSIGQSAENETVGTSLEPQDTHNMQAERGNVEPDYRHQFTSAWSYSLPFGPKQRWLVSSGRAHWLSEGWQVNGIVALYSGRSFTPYLSFDPTNTGSGGPRPDIIGDPYDFSNATTVGFAGGPGGCPSNQQSILCWFNPAAFTLPPLASGQQSATQFGNARRGILRGPAQYNVDFSLFKDFNFSESKSLQFRAEFFNLFNTPQFGDPNFLVDTPGAGSISSTVHSSRQIQFALKFAF
ncbi:MAG TPA: carboxypeptidase-like regulatory domain-containing protein [Terriglobales bacterium]|nr:carboxypeptidase-like regulatory domain-containing protein [Terriglobales bacterium]